MKITKTKNELVVKIPLWQNSYDAIGQLIGQVPKIIGVIAGDEIGFSWLNDLGYKGDQQEGEMFLKYYGEDDEFRKLCKELDIDVWEHSICAYCGKVLYGSFTISDKGYECFECEQREIKTREELKQYEKTDESSK